MKSVFVDVIRHPDKSHQFKCCLIGPVRILTDKDVGNRDMLHRGQDGAEEPFARGMLINLLDDLGIEHAGEVMKRSIVSPGISRPSHEMTVTGARSRTTCEKRSMSVDFPPPASAPRKPDGLNRRRPP